MSGKLLKTISTAELQAGPDVFSRDARNKNGSPVTRGVYYLKLETGNHTENKKIIVGK